MAEQKFEKGDIVTCKHGVEAYYSDYGGNPVMRFEPGDEGTVACITPKVCISGEPPVHDKKDEMVVIDFDCEVTGKKQRAALNFCNIKKVR